MTILWEEMVFLTNSAYGEESVEETIEMDATSVTSNTTIEIDLNIVIAPFFFFSLKPEDDDNLQDQTSETITTQTTQI
uniref:Uncharacterized protein n=1 Tax=Arabidopsis halleri subsp. halleri TaxID=81971 RepID=I0J3E5_ARAHH|nr:unknown [Arabidopsis halleri subsp. halleri]